MINNMSVLRWNAKQWMMTGTAPSMRYNCVKQTEDVSVSVGVSGSNGKNLKCKIVNGAEHVVNGCVIKNIAVTAKKWVHNKKTKM